MTVLAWILLGLFAVPYCMIAHMAWLFWRLTRLTPPAGAEGALHGARLCLLMCLGLLASLAGIAAQVAIRHEAPKPLPAEAAP